MAETSQPAPESAKTGRVSFFLSRLGWEIPTVSVLRELGLLLAVTAFVLFYGLVPVFGGDQLGLVGADEPRYAQIAREMLAQHNQICDSLHATMVPRGMHWRDVQNSYACLTGGTVTPILNGQPWLEKPALYYWRAMGFFREFGVSDWSARLPSSSGALALIVLIYLHMRRFRPGGHLDAALITASCLGIVAFARGASTDMQLAAPFCIGMLGWYAWYETGKKFWLFDLYFFGAAATLAKGPVAPFLALVIIFFFIALRREWSLLRRTIWIPGVLLYLVMVLPWYIAVQRRNPTFVRSFFLEHNLERFATNRYQHHQPFWFYAAVLVLGLMPWSILAFRALIDAIGISFAEWKARRNPQHYLSNMRAGDAFPEFLVLWALFPIVFFSFSGSKLPGYILPSIPPLTILTGDYLNRIRRQGLSSPLLGLHAALSAVMVFVLVLAPQHMKYETLVPPMVWLMGAAAAGTLIGVLIVLLVRRGGISQVLVATLIPVLGMLIFLLGFHGKDLDINYSARPLARGIAERLPGVKVIASLDIRRDMDYGLTFYRNQPIVHYGSDGVPVAEHVLVIQASQTGRLNEWLQNRVYQPVFLFESQGLAVYHVEAKR